MFKNLAIYLDKRIIAILFLGFSSGLPLLLVMSTLSFWLKDVGISITAIGLFSLVRIPYGFKFLWSPLIDRFSLPYLSKIMGRRRAWILFFQIMLMFSIFGLSTTKPETMPLLTIIFAVLTAFFSASQDIVIDAYRIEILEDDEQGAGSAMIVLGYRMAMLFSGAGAIWLAGRFPWNMVYMIMALACLVGIVTVLLAKEPAFIEEEQGKYKEFFSKAVIEPLKDFAKRPNAVLILLFIVLYKLCDTYMGPMAMPFYIETGFSKEEISSIIQVYGMGATILGGIIGGLFVKKYGIINSLFLGGVLQALSNLIYVAQAVVGHDPKFLILTISIENLSGGIGTTAFVAYMSSLCSVAYTATQYALLSSLMAFARDVIASSSGSLASGFGWINFFVLTSFMAVPGMIVLFLMVRKIKIRSLCEKD